MKFEKHGLVETTESTRFTKANLRNYYEVYQLVFEGLVEYTVYKFSVHLVVLHPVPLPHCQRPHLFQKCCILDC